jgi:signal transduction histidine kinase
MRFAKPRWLNSFSRQLLAASAGGVLFGAGLLIASLVGMRFFQGNLVEEIGVSEYAESIGEQLQFDSAGHPVSVGSTQMSWLFDSLGKEATFRVLNESGDVVLSSEQGASALTGDGEKPLLETRNFVFTRDGLTMHGATERVRHEGRNWYVQFASSERLSEMLRSYVGAPLFSRSVAFFGIGSLLLYLVVMRFLLRIVLRPLNEASSIAAEISPRNLGARLRVDGVPNELRPLVENFNAALDRLEHNYRLQQEFLTSAAHELKTPLALIRAQIEVGVTDASRDDLMRDISRMGRQVQQLLHLAEASEIQNYTFATTDARSLVLEVVNYLERLAQQQGVSLRVVGEPGGIPVRADRGALFTLLKNLIENAIQHSRSGGVVEVRADANLISIQDQGPGVSAEDLPKMFTRFWRGADRRDLGAGLGLSICQEIATAHGWDLQARRGDLGMAFDLRMTPMSDIAT